MIKTAYIRGLIKAAASNMQKHAAWWNPVDWGKAVNNWAADRGKALGNLAYDIINGDVDFRLKTYDHDKIPADIKDRAAGAANMSNRQALGMLAKAPIVAIRNARGNSARQQKYVNEVQQLSEITNNAEYARKMK